jgi:hypothetical protein
VVRWASSRQFVEQRLRFLQVERVEPFCEPPVDRSEQFAGLLRLPLIAPEPRHAHRGAEFPRIRQCCLRAMEGARSNLARAS